MTKEEYINHYDEIRNTLFEKYGKFFGYLIIDVFNILHMEKACEEVGLTTKRSHYNKESFQFYSEIYDKEKLIGIISNQGTPEIQFLNRCRKYTKLIERRNDIIEPIDGVHRVLRWHTVKGKYHILAGGETVLHFLPVKITDEDAIDFLTEKNLIDKVEEMKKIEKNEKNNKIL